MTTSLPKTHQALVLESRDKDCEVRTVPTPQPSDGRAIVQILASGVISYSREIYNGQRPYGFPTPLVLGCSAIGRIAAVGPDATLLEPGNLVFVDCVIRGRDDPSALFLSAISQGHSEGSKKLMHEVWRDGSYAEYAKIPLENCIPLDEQQLCGVHGYAIPELMYMSHLLVAYGGLRDIRVESGQTVVVCPATGGYGGAGVLVAAAMGAKVIAMGRNLKELVRLKEHTERTVPGSCVETVQITGDVEAETSALQSVGPVDAILDLTPPTAPKSTHIQSAIAALRYEGRISLMGLVDITSSPKAAWKLVGSNITMKGKLMYSREDMVQFVKMLERGCFPKSQDFVEVKTFALSDWKTAFDVASEWTGLGRAVAFIP